MSPIATVSSALHVFYVTNPRVKDLHLVPSIIETYGDTVQTFTSKAALSKALAEEPPDLIVCDRCTFLLTEEQISLMDSRCFNIHPSYLPYNRGYHPNFWSIHDGTPAGTTIHQIDNSIDTGRIVAQSRIAFSESDTLRSSYNKLRALSVALFREVYPVLRHITDSFNYIENPADSGSFHYKKDFDGIFEMLPNGWDTPIASIRKLAKFGS